MRRLAYKIVGIALVSFGLVACSGVQPSAGNKQLATDIGDYSPHHGRTDAQNYYRVGYDTQPPMLDWLQPDMPKYANAARQTQPLDQYDRRSGYRLIGYKSQPVQQVVSRPVQKIVREVVRKPVVTTGQQVIEHRDFVVYFDHDIDVLDAEALNTVDDVYDELQRQPGAVAILSGHADRSGNVDYNINLAERRSKNTRQALLNINTPNQRIQSQASGEHKNAIKTKDGVKERFNRRVEIRIR